MWKYNKKVSQKGHESQEVNEYEIKLFNFRGWWRLYSTLDFSSGNGTSHGLI